MEDIELKKFSLSRNITVDALVSAFHSTFPADFRYDGESHEGWEFVYVESGNVSVRADNIQYIIKSCEMVCHKPHEFHAIQSYHGAATVIITCFSCSSAQMKYFNNKILFISPRQKQYLNDIIINAGDAFHPKNPENVAYTGEVESGISPIRQQMIKNTLELLILSLLTVQSTERQKRVESYAQHLQRKTLTSDIITYMNENIRSKILLSDISKRFSYSQSSIKRIFQSETGCSMAEYLTDLRLAKAKELLCRNCSVTDTAQEVGFETVNYFSTVFRKKTGMSPTGYLKSVHASIKI